MSNVGILTASKNRISTPERWTKGTAARSVHGRKVAVTSKRAFCFCAVGAVERETQGIDDGYRSAIELLNLAVETPLPFAMHEVVAFNDLGATTHADVMALFDRALALAELRDQP